MVSRTSRDLRYAGIPETAIEITARFPEPGCDSLLAGALLTTRGGALRGLSQHAEARKCATEAAERSPKSFYPHNLLGALAYDEGNYVEGDEHFERAAQLGSRAKDQEREIRKALYKANAAGRSALIEYLLKKDPTKYAWVVIYEILETA